MAADAGSVVINIIGNSDKFKRELDGAGSKASSVFASAAGTVAKVFTGAVTAATTALVGLGKQAIDVGSSFETAFAQVKTIMDPTQMSITDMQTGIMDLSSELGISANELSESTYNAISATGDTAGALKLTEGAAKLATAGFTDTGSALSTLTTVMNSYGYSADEVGTISDSLIQVQNLGVTTIDQLSSSMGKAISTASAYGVDLGNLESGYVSLTKAGISTEESTTYMAAMFNELGDAGSAVGQVLQEKTGKSFGQLMADGNSLGDVLGILNESVDGNSEALMGLWGSAEAGKASNAIVSQGLETFNDNLETITTSTGTTEAAYETMCDTFEHQSDLLKTNTQNLGIDIYNGFSGGLKDMAKLGNEYIGRLSDGFKEGGLDGLISAAGEVLGDLISKISEFAPKLVQQGVNLIGALLQGIQKNSGTISQGLVSVATTLITGLSDMLPDLISTAMSVCTDVINAVAGALPTLIPKIVQALVDGLIALLSNADQLVGAAMALISGLQEGIFQALPVLIDALPEIISTIIDAIVGSIDMFIQATIQMVQAVVDNLPVIIQALVDALPEIITAVVDGLITGIPQIIDGAIQLFMAILEALPAIVQALIDSLPQIIDAVLQGLQAGWTAIFDAGGQLLGKIGEGLLSLLSDIGGWCEEVWTEFKDSFTKDFEAAVENGKELLNHIWTGICNVATNIGTWCADVWTKFKTSLSTNFRNAIDNGKTLLNNIWTGICNTATNISSWCSNVWGQFKDALTTNFAKAVDNGKKLLTNIWNGITGAWGAISSWGSQVWGKISSSFTGAFSKISQIGSDLISGLWNGISSMGDWIWQQISGFCGGIIDSVKGFFGIHSPSTVMRDQVGIYISKGLGEGITDGTDDVLGAVEDQKDAVMDAYSGMEAEIDVSTKAKVGLKDRLVAAVGLAKDAALSITSKLPGGNGASSISNMTTNNSNQVFNFYQPVETPDQYARKVRKANQYGLAGA